MIIPLANRPLAFVDTETTGLDPTKHEVIDVAVVFDREVAERLKIPHLTYEDAYAYFSSKVRPERIEDAEPKALEVNGYTPEAWVDAPSRAEVAAKLIQILPDTLMCGHNVNFDKSFIQAMIRAAGFDFRVDYHSIDTQTLAYTKLVSKGLTRLRLDAIREHLGWPTKGGHAALKDALDCRKLYHTLVQL